MKRNVSLFTLRIPVFLLVGHLAFGQTTFRIDLDGSQADPLSTSTAIGSGFAVLNADETELHLTMTHDVADTTAAHVHRGMPGISGPPVFTISDLSSPIDATWTGMTQGDVADLRAGIFYVNIHSTIAPLGEIRGQIEPNTDFGDAPDQSADEVKHFGRFTGHYPSLLETTNALSGRTGPYHNFIGEEMLGRAVEAETDADLTNLDAYDDGFRGMYFYLGGPVTAGVRYEVTVAADAPPVTRYLNVNADLNRNGRWGKEETGLTEWVIRNAPINVAPGTSEIVTLPFFPFNKGGRFDLGTWIRATLTRDPEMIEPSLFGVVGWDGSGPLGGFTYGETEDIFWYGIGGGGDDDDDDDDDDGGGGDDDGDKGDVYIKWLPGIVYVGEDGAWFCMKVCNPTRTDFTVDVGVTTGGNIGFDSSTPNPQTVNVPAGKCVWVCFYVHWLVPRGEEPRTDTGHVNIDPPFRDSMTFVEGETPETAGRDFFNPIQITSPRGAALTTYMNYAAFSPPYAPDELLLEAPEIPAGDNIAVTKSLHAGLQPDRVFYAVQIGPDGKTYEPPALVELPFCNTCQQPEGVVKNFAVPVKYNSDLAVWEPIANYVYEHSDDTISFEVTSLSLYGLAGATDTDGDGMPDSYEIAHNYDPNNNSDGTDDEDGDGLNNSGEFTNQTDPADPDSDNDGYYDSVEVAHGSSPIDDASVPAPSSVAGDLDLSNSVDAVDVQIAINGALGIATSVPTDVDGDNDTDAVDIQLVINAALGIAP